MNYYMLLCTCVQYTYAHFHASIATVLVFFQVYVLLQLYEELTPWISTLNALANLFDTFMLVDFSWTNGLSTTLLNPL